jgi:prepilin-type N-terminal cleavage/methylation domain-containing protein
MLHKLQQRKDAGFTIIEVMIVLAIAGLIMLIVFLAVPALQRNSHNTTRKNDIGRLGSAVNDWVSNNNGQVLTAGASNANLTTIINDAGSLGQYTLAPSSSSLSVVDGSGSAQTALSSIDKVVIVTGAQCDQNGTTKPGTSRQLAIQYMLEASGSPIPACQNV